MKIASYTRVKKLREFMKQQGVDAYVHPNTDPHQSEYIPEHWQCIQWLTGFSGEAATIAVTADRAALWTDSRFFIQGAQQLKGSPFELMKIGNPGTPTMAEWLRTALAAEGKVTIKRKGNASSETQDENEENRALCKNGTSRTIGYDGRILSHTVAESLRQALGDFDEQEGSRYAFRNDFRPMDTIWDKRPAPPHSPAEEYPEEFSGEATADRIDRIVEAFSGKAEALLLSRLDDIAWAFNIRGHDIHCTPVVTAYALIEPDITTLFIDPDRMDEELFVQLAADINLDVCPYERLEIALEELPEGHRVMADPSETGDSLWSAITALDCILVEGNPVPQMRAVKNEVEIDGVRSVMIRDGIVLTRFFRWLEQRLETDGTLVMGNGTFFIDNEVTEADCAAKLIALREEQPLYFEESFDAVVAWKAHAALPHYAPTPESSIPIAGDGLLLVDTGGQYSDGTTDVTRTIPIGCITPAMRRDYTLVLKGHIRLATAVFPVGTRGDQLDALARLDLWRDGKTFRHGTGHGVGHFLNVHEGPQSIRMEHNPQPLVAGMIVSDEPAVYIEGQYGIRHENCLLVRPFDVRRDAPCATPCGAKEMGDFLCFETLTLCYIDTRAVEPSLLTTDERDWLNAYNRRVYESLAPHLDADEAEWLRGKTMPI